MRIKSGRPMNRRVARVFRGFALSGQAVATIVMIGRELAFDADEEELEDFEDLDV